MRRSTSRRAAALSSALAASAHRPQAARAPGGRTGCRRDRSPAAGRTRGGWSAPEPPATTPGRRGSWRAAARHARAPPRGRSPCDGSASAARLHADSEEVARRPHLDGGPLGDALQHVVDVARVDQVRGGAEHAVEADVHRVELAVQGGDLLGLGGVGVAVNRPGRPVSTRRPARRGRRHCSWWTVAGGSPNRIVGWESRPQVQAQSSALRANPGAAAAVSSAYPGPQATQCRMVAVLNLVAVVAMRPSTASGEPSERSSVATGEPWRRAGPRPRPPPGRTVDDA